MSSMERMLLFLFVFTFSMFSCTNDQATTNPSNQETEESFSQRVEDTSDKVGIVRGSLEPINAALSEAANEINEYGQVGLTINDDFILVFSNNQQRQEVDIRLLDKNNARLITEDEGFGFPGVGIGTKGYQNLINTYEGDSQVGTANELVLLFKNRDDVSKHLPIIFQSISVAKGEFDQYYD